MKIQDDFDKLRTAIDKAGDPDRARKLLTGTGRMIVEAFMAELEQLQPVDVSMAWKPSIRRGYTPIASGWQPVDIGDTEYGISLSLKSRSKHINWQRFGTPKKNYPIPNLPTGVSFWWGAPLPWSPSEIPEYITAAPGMFWFLQIEHPGIKPYGGEDFVRRAWTIVRSQAIERFRTTANEILFQPFREMG